MWRVRPAVAAPRNKGAALVANSANDALLYAARGHRFATSRKMLQIAGCHRKLRFWYESSKTETSVLAPSDTIVSTDTIRNEIII